MVQEKTGNLLKKVGLLLGPILFCLMLTADLGADNVVATRMASVAILMTIWWVTEAIPLAAIALLPLILYPLLGILKGSATAPSYANSIIFLFLGGFVIALTMEKWNLHQRIALRIISLVGGGSTRIILGFISASALLSMWISNTATAIMMIPMGLAIIRRMEDEFGKRDTHNFAVSLLLGIAYGCSIGRHCNSGRNPSQSFFCADL